MRSYIFTARERQLLEKVLNGEISIKAHVASSTLSRIRTFKALAADVDLYLRIRSRLTEPETTTST